MTTTTITLSLPADTSLAVPDDPDRWERRDGHIIAAYTREELAVTVGLALEQKREMLETRLARGLAIMEAATGCNAAEAGRMLAHWDALNAEYAATAATLTTVIYQIEEA